MDLIQDSILNGVPINKYDLIQIDEYQINPPEFFFNQKMTNLVVLPSSENEDEQGCVEIKYCQIGGCKKKATYNLRGLTPILCRKHKMEGMHDLISNICSFDGCSITASFNYMGFKKPRFCRKHKLDGMMDVKHPQCQYYLCLNRAYFGYKSLRRAQFCKNHMKKEMIKF